MTRRFSPEHWFLPAAPDVLGLLVHQGEITLEGLNAFEDWAHGEPAKAKALRASEHAADEQRRAVVAALRQAFTTPVEPEDLYELSERLDAVLNQAKDLVREAEVLQIAPDQPMAEMTHLVLDAARDLVAAFGALAGSDEAATEAANAAIRRRRQIERVYRGAMSALLESKDPREIGGRRELYRRYARVGDAIEAVADRVGYALVKRT
ncbi:MAG: DUF47 family protein [Acidimicrobiales bacterium]